MRAARRLVSGTPSPVARSGRRSRKAPRPVVAMTRRIDKAFASGRPRAQVAAAREVHELVAHTRLLASPADSRDPDKPLGAQRGVRSMQYMIELLPHIQRLVAEQPRGTVLRVVDIGPGTGHGTALLAELYDSGALGYRMKVTGLDIVDTWATYITTTFPNVRFVQADAYEHDRVYDIVLSTHAIEHIPDPVRFCRRMQEMARLAVFVSAPFNEPADRLTQGHINVIDDAFVAELDPVEAHVHQSACWGAFTTPRYDSITLRLEGLVERSA